MSPDIHEDTRGGGARREWNVLNVSGRQSDDSGLRAMAARLRLSGPPASRVLEADLGALETTVAAEAPQPGLSGSGAGFDSGGGSFTVSTAAALDSAHSGTRSGMIAAATMGCVVTSPEANPETGAVLPLNTLATGSADPTTRSTSRMITVLVSGAERLRPPGRRHFPCGPRTGTTWSTREDGAAADTLVVRRGSEDPVRPAAGSRLLTDPPHVGCNRLVEPHPMTTVGDIPLHSIRDMEGGSGSHRVGRVQSLFGPLSG